MRCSYWWITTGRGGIAVHNVSFSKIISILMYKQFLFKKSILMLFILHIILNFKSDISQNNASNKHR